MSRYFGTTRSQDSRRVLLYVSLCGIALLIQRIIYGRADGRSGEVFSTLFPTPNTQYRQLGADGETRAWV